MLLFMSGVFVGVLVTLLALGFLAVVAEESEQNEAAKRKRQQEQRRMRELEDWYRSYTERSDAM